MRPPSNGGSEIRPPSDGVSAIRSPFDGGSEPAAPAILAASRRENRTWSYGKRMSASQPHAPYTPSPYTLNHIPCLQNQYEQDCARSMCFRQMRCCTTLHMNSTNPIHPSNPINPTNPMNPINPNFQTSPQPQFPTPNPSTTNSNF